MRPRLRSAAVMNVLPIDQGIGVMHVSEASFPGKRENMSRSSQILFRWRSLISLAVGSLDIHILNKGIGHNDLDMGIGRNGFDMGIGHNF